MNHAPHEQQDGAVAAAGVSNDRSARSVVSSMRMRVSDFLELAKFRLSLLVLVVAAAGFCLGAPAAIDLEGVGIFF
ncbi:MAG: hypothetical protein KDA33_12885, partial [Phycisphaerales bacterium]|nr:hypothetical protein [Phycisphaerales bacterium]